MKFDRFGGICLALVVGSAAIAQDSPLTRPDVAAIKAKLVTVQKALGAEPEGYLREPEEFSLPTTANPAQGGKYWPITSSVSLRLTDRASKEGEANAEQAAKDFEAKYMAAIASGDPNAMMAMNQEMMRITQAAAAAGMSMARKEDMQVYVQFNMSPYAGIDPDAVVFESPGVIALRRADGSDGAGQVTVYLDPVALAQTETLAALELRTPEGGVTNKLGVFNIMVTLHGTLADAEAWAETFDTGAMLSVIDSQ